MGRIKFDRINFENNFEIDWIPPAQHDGNNIKVNHIFLLVVPVEAGIRCLQFLMVRMEKVLK